MSFVKPLQLLQIQCVNCARNKLLVTSYHMTSHFTRRSFSSSSYLCEKRAARERAQRAREETVFQHAGKDPKRADRVYGWGFAQTGALGVRRFMRPEKGYKQRHTQFNPHKLEFFDMLHRKVFIASKWSEFLMKSSYRAFLVKSSHKAEPRQVVNIGCGYGFTVFVCRPKEELNKYMIYGTGINTDSQIGYHEYPHKSGRILDQLIEPAQIRLPLENADRTQVHSVSCGRAHTVIHTSEAVFSLGNNVHGQCGRRIVEGETFGKSQTINKINIDPHQIKQIECGQDHTLFVMESGEVFACGLSSDGQTGQGHYRAVDTVTKVTGDIEGERIVQVSSKADTVLAVSDKGDVFGWGNSEYSQLSIVAPDESQVNTSRHLPFTQVGKVTKVTAGGSLCAVVNDAGDVYVWGYGILGKGPNVDSAEFPTRIPPTLFGRNEFNTETKVKDVQAGLTHLMAVNSEGELFAWGKNRVGTLGLAHNKDQFFPFKVMVPAETQRVFCGIDHTVVMAKAFV